MEEAPKRVDDKALARRLQLISNLTAWEILALADLADEMLTLCVGESK